jgi:hypothetical protein
MIALMTSTNTDKLKMVFAGVDSGAKILVRPVEEAAVFAAAVARKQSNNPNVWIPLRMIGLFVRRIFVDPLLFELRADLQER